MNVETDLRRPFSATAWNRWMSFVERNRPLSGVGCDIRYTQDGIALTGHGAGEWRHPWWVTLRWEWKDVPTHRPERWMAYVRPGFVNGRDARILRPARLNKPEEWVPLTSENAAGLWMRWHNPLAVSASSVTLEGDVIEGRSEGYPVFFERLGVKVPAPGEPDPTRTREIRSCDIFLATARLAVAQDVRLMEPLLDSAVVRIESRFVSDAVLSMQGQHRLFATPRWDPPLEPTALQRLDGTAFEPTTDEIKIATVWVVSPPEWPEDEEPNWAWTPYVQYSVFWNLMHASIQQVPGVPQPPIELRTGLALGIADPLFAAMIGLTVNDPLNRVEAYFKAGSYKGEYWSV